jgi:hypothetical protein
MQDIAPLMDGEQLVERPRTLLDASDPLSLVNMVSDRLRELIEVLPEELFLLSEKDLKNRFKPTSTDYALRVSFWREFEKVASRGGGKIHCVNVFAGICSEAYFYNKFIRNESKLAWMVRPMQTYQREMEAILAKGTERLWELIEIKIKDKKGRVDPRLADILLKTISAVENRVKGMAVQRTEQKSLNVNVMTGSKANHALESVDAIEQRIKQLESGVLNDDA